MRPIIFLDFDGVINALRHDERAWPDWRRPVISDGLHNYRVTFSPTLCRRLAALAGHVDFVWCTTWRDTANTDLSPHLKFPGDWPVIGTEFDSYRYNRPDWKFMGVKQFLLDYPGRPFVWIDDDVCRQDFVLRWKDQLPQANLLIAPSSYTGLTEPEVEEIENFVRKFAA